MTRRFVLILLILAAAVPAHGAARNEFVIDNGVVKRTVTFHGGPLRTTKIEAHGVQVLAQAGVEFLIDIDYKGEPVTFAPSDFVVTGYETSEVGQETEARVTLRSTKPDAPPVIVHLRYFALENAPYLQKSLVIQPEAGAKGAILRRVTLEMLTFAPDYVPVSPANRLANDPSGGIRFDASDPAKRFDYGARSDFAVFDQKSQKGVFFFQASLFGREVCTRGRGLDMAEDLYLPLEKGYETGRATVGVIPGPPEVLYKRFREFVWENYCVVRGKPWLAASITSPNATEQSSLDTMKAMADGGCADTFCLGAGWENHYPLTEDAEKFPQGTRYLAEQAKSMGLRMGYSINPLGSNGQTTETSKAGGAWDGLLKEHPDWCATYDAQKNPSPKGDDILCFTTPYADFVEQRLLRLVTEGEAALLHIEGNDWSKFACPPSGPYHVEPKILPYAVVSKLSSIYGRLRKANKDLVISLSPGAALLPSAVHRLNILDQIDFTGGASHGALADRQWRYYHAFVLPPRTMFAGGSGIAADTPLPRAKYEAVSSISGSPQVQGPDSNAELAAYLKRLCAFRRRFESYFRVYQHVLGFPDGASVDGEGHIAGGKGFIILYNPSDTARKIALPLDEPELELRGELTLSDWTELDNGTDLGKAKPGDKVEIELGPLSARIVGVNIAP